MPRAAPRSFLRKTNLRLNSGGVAPQATVYESETADQELQIKKIMISGGSRPRKHVLFHPRSPRRHTFRNSGPERGVHDLQVRSIRNKWYG